MSALHGCHGAFFELTNILVDCLCDDFDSLGHPDIGQAYEPGVGNSAPADRVSEVFAYWMMRSRFSDSASSKQSPVAGVGADSLGFERVMPVIPKPIRQSASGASICQKSHAWAAETVDRVSRAMTA